MANDYEVNFDISGTMRQINERRDAVLNKLAFRCEGLTKGNMNVDTGFMRNSTQAMTVGSAATGAYAQTVTGRNGVTEQRIANGRPGTDSDQSGVSVAADYAFWQELKHPALQPAADQALSELAAIAREESL